MTTDTNTMLTMPVAPTYAAGNSCGGGWGNGWGDSWLFLIVILALWGGFGNNGWGNGMNGGGAGTVVYDTGAGMQRGFDTAAITGKLDRLGDGICSLGYDQLGQTNNIQMALASGFAGLNDAFCNQSFQIERGVAGLSTQLMQSQNTLQAQLAGGFGDIREGISGVNYNMAMNANAIQNSIQSGFCQTNYNAATNTRDIIESQNANTRAILDKLTAQEIATKDAQIAAQNQQIFGLQLKASQEAQNSYLVNQLRPCPTPSYITCNPWASQASYGSCGSYSGCGCGCN